MKTFRKYFALSLTIIALSIVSVSAHNLTDGTVKPAQSIDQQVYKKLRGLTYYGVFDNITYQVQGNTVILSGKVNSLGTKSEAGNVIKRIPGVERVVNNIENLPPSSFDDSIRRQAFRAFTEHGPGQYFSEINPDVRIIVEGGHITLEGYVNSSGDSNTLNILANGISGVFSVQNNLIVGKDTRWK